MTGMAEAYLASRGGEQLLADIPLGRVADPGEIGEMARWCALDAPPSLTGAVLDANGASSVRCTMIWLLPIPCTRDAAEALSGQGPAHRPTRAAPDLVTRGTDRAAAR